MPFIPVDMTTAVESHPVRNGRYDLTITSVDEVKTKEKGLPQLKCALVIEGNDAAPTLYHYVGLPAAGDEPDKANFKKLLLARFCKLFNVKYDDRGFDTDDLIGARATAEVTLSEPDANGNIYNRLVVPKMPDEGSAGSAKPAGSSSRKPPKS